MSLLGCIGYIMSNSGMGNALELIYTENTVVHLLSGRAVDEAVRGASNGRYCIAYYLIRGYYQIH